MKTLRMNNGSLIPTMALGTWKYAPGAVGQAVKYALECGYRHLDCAHIYMNEDEIGQALKEVFSEGKIKREDVFITSKLWSDSHEPEDVFPACLTTLNNLQLKYLDLYQIHMPQANARGVVEARGKEEGMLGYSPEGISKTWKAMESLVEKGLCRAIGVCNFTSRKLQKLIETADIVPACNQVELQPYLPQMKLKEFCDRYNIILSAHTPLGSPDNPYPRKATDPVVLTDPVLGSIAKKHNCSIAQVALSWSVRRGTCVAPKAASPSHIKENFESLNIKLDEQDMAAIKNIGINHRYGLMSTVFELEDLPESEYWDGEM